jgi:hypothetical protein
MTRERKEGSRRPGGVLRAFRWVFISRRNGRVTVAQWPNLPLAIFLLCTLASRIFHPSGAAATFVRVVGVAALIGWALDEVARGVNPFRRMLGAAVLVTTVVLLVLR